MPAPNRSHALDHIVVVLFENRSLDNVLGHLYRPEDDKNFDGVIGKDLSNPIPEWAEHGADRKVVPYTVATDMDSPNPDSGEEYYHTNTQLYNTLDEHNRFKIGEAVAAPWNAPPLGAVPTMDGFVTDYISTFTGAIGRQPSYDEYAHIMTGCTPRTAAGAQRHRPGFRSVRPLVLRGAVPDVYEPVVLDSGHLLGVRGEQPDEEVVHRQRRRDDL
jgi:phospholipase C